MVVEAVIEHADLTAFDIRGVDRVNVALALQRLYGGQLVASYASHLDFTDQEPAHVAVRIDGTLYDGNGVTSDEAVREHAYDAASDQTWDDVIVIEIQRPDNEVWDSERVDALVERFEAAEARLGDIEASR